MTYTGYEFPCLWVMSSLGMHNADLSHIPRNPWPMTTNTQERGNNTHRKHKITKHRHTHKKKSASPPHLNRCLRYVPQVSCTLFGCLLALEISEGHGPPTKRGWLFNKRCFYIIIWTYQLFEEGVSQAEAYPEETPHPAQGNPTWVTWI